MFLTFIVIYIILLHFRVITLSFNTSQIKNETYLHFKSVGLDVLSSADCQIVSDFLNIEDTIDLDPSLNFTITFKNNKKEVGLTSNNRLAFDLSLTKYKPRLNWNVKENTTYMIIMLDIDYPNGRGDIAHDKQFLLWLAYPILKVNEIPEYPVKYMNPFPISKSTTPHRYVYTLLESPNINISNLKGFTTKQDTNGEYIINRELFNFKSFSEENHLKLVAIDFFMANPL